jgi:type I restriction enzyme S subunit
MEEWKNCYIGDVCSTISETYKANSSEVVLVNTSDVLEGKCLNHIKVDNKDLKGQFKKAFHQNDILYSEIRPANKRFAFIDFEPTDYIASTKLMVIRNNESILPEYLFYILQSKTVIEELQMLAESRSGTFPQITFSEVSRMQIKLPNTEEQIKILGVLKSLDKKIELNRRINDNLEQQAQALYQVLVRGF